MRADFGRDGCRHLEAPPVVPERAAAPARDSYEALISAHLDGLYGTARRLTRNPASAEDLVQETMLKAWRSFHTFQPGTNGRAWLYRILMNAYFDAQRKQSREPELVAADDVGDLYRYGRVRDDAVLRDSGNPEVVVLDHVMDDAVRAGLEALPTSFLAAVLLVDVDGFAYKEAAEVLGIPVGTVMSRLYRGRHALRGRLIDYVRRRRLVRQEGAGDARRPDLPRKMGAAGT